MGDIKRIQEKMEEKEVGKLWRKGKMIGKDREGLGEQRNVKAEAQGESN